MEFIDALSGCWLLGKNCVPVWEAWAAAGGIAAVVTTGLLGVVTYRLGRAANRASSLAVEIAGNESRRQAERDRKERILVLMQITGEVSTNRQELLALAGRLNEQGSEGYFSINAPYRQEFLEYLYRIEFPVTWSLTDRLHYLDGVVGPCLVRAGGLLKTLQWNYRSRLDAEPVAELINAHRLMRGALPRIADDLEVVRLACEAAIRETGIDDPRVAREALRNSGVASQEG